MARYGQAFKDRAVARLLPPGSAPVKTVSRELGVSVATLERWRAVALAEPERERIWTAAARLEAVIATAAMDEAARSAWCRQRLFEGDLAERLLREVLAQAQAADLTSAEHFSLDGTLVEAWASQQSFRAKDGSDEERRQGPGRNAGRDFRGEQRSNETHASTTDPDSRLYRKSHAHPAKLCYGGHILMENRTGLVVGAIVTPANQTAEHDAALRLIKRFERASTLGADKAYDTRDFVAGLRRCKKTPHVAQNTERSEGSTIDVRTTRHVGYGVSQVIRKRVEEPFGRADEIGPLRKTKLRGLARVGFQFVLTMAAYNLVRMRNLMATA